MNEGELLLLFAMPLVSFVVVFVVALHVAGRGRR